MSFIFDSHAHYDDDAFGEDRLKILEDLSLKENVCGILNCGCDIDSSKFSIELSEKFPFVFAAVGIHPHNAANVNNDYIQQIGKLSENPNVKAIGEIGLDYHYDFSPHEAQIKVFSEQLELAKKRQLPVIVHDREAHGDMYNILNEYRPLGVVHCFSGSVELAKQALSYGMYIGLGGAVTFKNAKTPVEVAMYVPEDRILIETDAPYMTPVPFRGKRCDSGHIIYTAKHIAQVRGTTVEHILEITRKNANRLFGLNL